MLDTAIPSILGGFTEGLIGGVLGIIGTLLLIRLNQSRKIIEYDVFSMPLAQLKPSTTPSLMMSVDKAVLTGQQSDTGVPVQIHTAYGFEIELRNTGNVPIEQLHVEIRLHSSGRIIQIATEPESRSGYTIDKNWDPEQPNIVRFSVPYINKGAQILIRLISTENATAFCRVHVMGVGVKARPRPAFPIGKGAVITVVAFSILGFILTDYPSVLLSPDLIDILGGETIIRLAFWPRLVLVVITILPWGWIMAKMVSRDTVLSAMRRARSWDEVLSQPRDMSLLQALRRALSK